MKRTEQEAGKNRIKKICMKSFFNGVASRCHRNKRTFVMTVITAFVALAMTAVLLNNQVCYAVYMNGAQVGSAKSIQEVNDAISSAENKLSKILGYDYSLDRSITVTPNLGSATDGTEEMENKILNGISGVKEMYVIEVEGTPVGASQDKSVLDGILNGILKEYTADTTETSKFTNDISVNYEYVGNNVTTDADKIRALLEPSNTSSAYRLSVETTSITQLTEQVAYNTTNYNDPGMYQGDSKVVTEGVNGENLVTKSTAYINGNAQSEDILSTVVEKAPVAEVVANGTMAKPLTASTGSFIWPTSGKITSPFGYRGSSSSKEFHKGIDIAGSYGQDIKAADGGTVIYAGWDDSGYGNLVEIQHDNGDITYYGHNSSIVVAKGDKVYQGQIIAHMGATGNATGVHCHFEIRVANTPVNPMSYLS